MPVVMEDASGCVTEGTATPCLFTVCCCCCCCNSRTVHVQTDASPSDRSSCPAEFWGDVAKDFFWKTKHTGQFLDYNFDVTKGEIYIKCMEGASTNICYNLLDRNVHEKKLADKVAFFWSVCVCDFSRSMSARLCRRVCVCVCVLWSRDPPPINN